MCTDGGLRDQGGGGGRLVLPVGIELAGGAVVTSESVDTGFDQNQTELGVLVLAVALKMLAHGDSLLDEHVKILRDGRGEAVLLKDTKDLAASDRLDLGNAVLISQDDTDLN